MSLNRHHDFSSSVYGQAGNERRLRARRASVSSSEEGHGGYDTGKHDDVDGGEDYSLTSQTLNADGTPKRPMNAFMIFARRRRPQVSAENQSLRTGEVSKLLSKEWSAMPASEKQFYQEQAKLLKDSFNSKYPDYVYRRRPNNSRRRRRSDAGAKDGDLMGDLGDEAVSPGGFDSADGDEHFEVGGSDYSFSRPQQDGALLRDPSGLKYGPRTSQPSLSSDLPFRQGSVSEGRLPFAPPPERMSQNMGSLLTPRVPPSSQTATGLYGQMSSSSAGDFNSQETWNGRPNRVGPMWSEGLQQDRNGGGYKLDIKAVSIGASENWSHSPTSSNDSSNSPHNLFSSLTSPFNGHPNQTAMQSYKTASSSTAQYPQSNSTNLASNRAFDPRGTSVLGMNEPLVYPARTVPRELPPVHTISGYSSQSASSVNHMGSPQVYPWARDFYGNGRNEFDLMGISGLKDQS